MAVKRQKVDLVGCLSASSDEEDGAPSLCSFSEEEDSNQDISDDDNNTAPFVFCRHPCWDSTSSPTPPELEFTSGRKRGCGLSFWPTPEATYLGSGWQTEHQPDVLPEPLPPFCPSRTPGVQQRLGISDDARPSELFKAFFDENSVNVICENTNKKAQRNIEKGKKFKWSSITPAEFFKYVGLLFYMAILKLPQVTRYWRQNSFFSVSSPAAVMPRSTFQSISWNLHMSDPEKDSENDQKTKGSGEYDPLQRLRPLYDHLRASCKEFYHPRQKLSVKERLVTTNGNTHTRKSLKTNCVAKLFVLADSFNGYTYDFSICTGESDAGPPLDSVLALLDPFHLGGGYHLYCDNSFTSPRLFTELLAAKIRACGTYKDPRKANATAKTTGRGAVRWFRDGPLLFTKWTDCREVSVCSTIHTAYSGEVVKRRIKASDGRWREQDVPVPTPVADYNRHKGGGDLSDQLIQYYSVQHRTRRWHQSLFQHFVDIAAANSYILHKELRAAQKKRPLSHLEFMETLSAELCGYPLDSGGRASGPLTPPNLSAAGAAPTVVPSFAGSLRTCVPVAVNPGSQKSKKATEGRLTCVRCKRKTAWKCRNCNAALCLIVDRNCFMEWHDYGAPLE